MHSLSSRRGLWTLLIGLPATATAALTPLADRVPGSAVVYVGWAGTDALQPAYAKSHLKTVLDDSNLVEVVREQWPTWMAKLGDSANPARVAAAEASLAIVLRHPACFFVTADALPAGGPPQGHVGIMVDAGDDAAELQKDLQAMQPDGNENAHPQFGSINGVVWHVVGSSTPFEPVHGGADSLAANARMIASQNHLAFADAPAVSMFIDVAAALKLADHAAEQDETVKTDWVDVRDALGLTGVESLGAAVGFNGADWSSEVFLSAPSPRRGLLAAVEPKPIDAALLRCLPAEIDDITAVNFDVAGVFDAIKAAAGVDPKTADIFGKVMGAANLFLGRNVRRQLIAPLGSQWVLAFSSTEPKDGTLLNAVSDARTLQDSLTTATYAISNTLNIKLPAQADGTPGAVASREKRDGITVTTVTTAVAKPSWAIHDSVLAVAASPDAVMRAFASTGSPVGGSAVVAVKQAFKLPPSATMGGFAFADLPRSAPAMYARLAATGPVWARLAEQFHLALPDLRFPTLEQLRPDLSPAMSVDWAEVGGIGMRATSPFPGSGVLSGSQDFSAASVGGVAIGTSILLPSLNRARETANKVKSASNERQIGQAILMYGNEHRGQYPATLGELVTEAISPQVFVSPLSSNSVPAGLDTPDKQSDWINQHSDYVFVGKGLTNACPPDAIVLYEKAGAGGSDGGMNVLYGDGHVEYQDAAAAAQIRSDHPAP